MRASWFCLLFGIAYAWQCGFFGVPYGLEAALACLLLLGALRTALTTEQITLPPWHRVMYLCSLLTGISFAYTSNQLVNAISSLVISIELMLLFLSLAGGRTPPAGFPELFVWTRLFALSFLRNLFGFAAVRIPRPKIDQQVWLGLLFGLPPLIVFHLLFRAVNAEYAAVVRTFVEWLISLEIWLLLFHGLIHAHVLYSLFAARLESPDAAHCDSPRRIEASFALLPCILLLFFFSWFQGKLLGADLAALPFRDLSLYTQEGFWELVAAALFGWLCWNIVRWLGADISPRLTLGRLLGVFCAELIALCFFSLHKITALQYFFGLKDSRILATCGVILVLTAFGICLARSLLPAADKWMIKAPLLLLAAISVAAANVNIDLLVTRVHPISHVAENVRHKDYAYLLTNSYDNYEEWGELMLELLQQPIVTPKNYYWGSYYPLCTPAQAWPPVLAGRNFVREHHERLRRRTATGGLGARAVLHRHLRESAAVDWLRANGTLVYEVLSRIDHHCAGAAGKDGARRP